MTSLKDPHGAERAALGRLVDFRDRRVLEIGCGDGRMTWLYAGDAAKVLGVDSDAELVAEARRTTPPDLRDRVRFRVADAVKLRVRRASFDIALLAWSL